MLFKSTVFAQAAGSVAGGTYSHNKGGMYMRSRSTPINPASAQQQAVRAGVKQLTTRWGSVLTAAQRLAWKTYADNVPLVNKLGEARPIPALAMYVRCNAPRVQAGTATPIVDDGPTTFALATFPVPVVTWATPHFSVAFDNTADWAIADDGGLFYYVSTAQSQTINFFKGPFRFGDVEAGNTATPPTSPLLVTVHPTPVSGQRYFLRFRASNADGRLSSAYIVQVDIP